MREKVYHMKGISHEGVITLKWQKWKSQVQGINILACNSNAYLSTEEYLGAKQREETWGRKDLSFDTLKVKLNHSSQMSINKPPLNTNQ